MTAPAAGAHTPTITRALEQQLRETLAVLPRQGHPLGPREERRYRLERGLEAIRLCEAVGERLPVAMEVAVRATLDAAREEIAGRESGRAVEGHGRGHRRGTASNASLRKWAEAGIESGRPLSVPAKYLVVSWRVGRRGSGRDHVVGGRMFTACGLRVPKDNVIAAVPLDAPRLCASCVAVARRAK